MHILDYQPKSCPAFNFHINKDAILLWCAVISIYESAFGVHIHPALCLLGLMASLVYYHVPAEIYAFKYAVVVWRYFCQRKGSADENSEECEGCEGRKHGSASSRAETWKRKVIRKEIVNLKESLSDEDGFVVSIWTPQSQQGWVSITLPLVLSDAAVRAEKRFEKTQNSYVLVDFIQTELVLGPLLPEMGGEPMESTLGYDWLFSQPPDQKENIKVETQKAGPKARDLDEDKGSYDGWIDDFLDLYTAHGVVEGQEIAHDMAHRLDSANRTVCNLIEVCELQLRDEDAFS